MKKRVIILIGVCLFVSVTIVTVLFMMSGNIAHRGQSFIRLFPPHPLHERDTLDIKYNSYYFSGATSHQIYLGNYTAPLHMLILNTASMDTQYVELKIRGIESQKFWSLTVKVDSPKFYVSDGTLPRIYEGSVEGWTAERSLYDSVYFIDLVPLGISSFAIRSLSSSSNEYTLGKISKDTPHVEFRNGLLQRQIDGRFCVDGMMHYDKESARLVYLYFYRNQFTVMDTNLNLDYHGKTIDTISRAQIKVAKIASSNMTTTTMSAPPLIVNKRSRLSNDLLFVNSNLMAKNESPQIFDMASVIDVYNLKERKYKFSFYLFDYGDAEMSDFYVIDDKLIALFDRYVVLYYLLPQYFNE